MAAHIIIKKRLRPGAVADNMTHLRGFPVEVHDVDYWSASDAMRQVFVQLILTDRNAEEVRQYCATWNRILNFSIVAHNPTLDGYRVRAECDPSVISALTKMNALTRDQVENLLGWWNATVFSTAENEVVFDAGIYNALVSPGFWAVKADRLAAFSFNEDSYDEGTGVHIITVTYPLSVTKNNVVEKIINQLGLSAVVGTNDAARQITFEAGRLNVRTNFLNWVKAIADRPVFRKRWVFEEDLMLAIEAAGGSMETTAAQALIYLHDRLED